MNAGHLKIVFIQRDKKNEKDRWNSFINALKEV